MLQSVETKHQEPCRIQTENPKDTSWQTCQAMLSVPRSFYHIVRDYNGSKKLIPSIVRTKLGPVTYVPWNDILTNPDKEQIPPLSQRFSNMQIPTSTQIHQKTPTQDEPCSTGWRYPERVRPPSDHTSDCEYRTFDLLAGVRCGDLSDFLKFIVCSCKVTELSL